MGELEGLTADETGRPVALIGHVGFLGFGEILEPVPLDMLLGSTSFVVLSTDRPPGRIGSGN